MLPINLASQSGPFPNIDIFNYAVLSGHTTYGEIFLCARVSKSWEASIRCLNWKQFSKYEGIPQVEEGPGSDEKQEFRILYPRTFGGRICKELFGNFEEEIPCVSRACFLKFFKEDPFEPKKMMMDTFKLVVIPAFFERASGEEFPYKLDSKGDLQQVKPCELKEQKLQIPTGIRNLEILCKHPRSGKDNMPVFRDFVDDSFELCYIPPKKISLCFMRMCIVQDGDAYVDQQALVESKGFVVSSLRDKAFYDAISVLTSQTPSNAYNPWEYARTSDSVDLGHSNSQMVIGGYIPKEGVEVSFENAFDDDNFGVIPVVSAEAPGVSESNVMSEP